MSKTKKRKSGAGRRKGAVSFCLVPLTELNAKLSSGAIILVSKKFAESVGIEGQAVTAIAGTGSRYLPCDVKANAVQVTNLNDEETAPELSVDNW
jgi:hypothetical protein